MDRVLLKPRKVIEVRGIQRVPQIERWDKDALNNIISTLAQWMVPDDMEESQAVFLQRNVPAVAPIRAEKTYVPRRVYIAQEPFERYGYSHNCRRCGNMRQGLGTHGLSHTPLCRNRMEQQMRSDGDARIIAADLRFSNEVSEQLAGNRQIVDIQEENAAPNNNGVLNWGPNGVLNGVPNNNGVLKGDNNNGNPAPTIPKV